MLRQFLAHHRFILSLTVLIWLLIGWQMGLAAFFITVILSILEITLSADNAVVNSRVLIKMSAFWQKIFLTVGIFIAVFVVRFALPIVAVSAMTPLSSGDVLNLALYDAETYGNYLKEISPIIEGFGGMFLALVALFFFMERGREHLWLYPIEAPLRALARFRWLKYVLATGIGAVVVQISDVDVRLSVAIAVAAGAAIYLVLHAITRLMTSIQKRNETKKQVGWVAFVSFMYLEVLDASFSLDGVVGAFALTNNIVIIMAGLGIGALWVRTMTLYMVKHKTLTTFRYLESGAHWAIVCLALVMFLKLAHIEVPEIIIGSIGLVFIILSLVSSHIANKVTRKKRRAKRR